MYDRWYTEQIEINRRAEEAARQAAAQKESLAGQTEELKKTLASQNDLFKQMQEKISASPTTDGVLGTTELKAQVKYDSQGRPIRNNYLSMLGDGGKLKDQFSFASKIGPGVNLDQSALSEIRNRAMSQGPSAWAQLAQQQQQLQEQSGLDNAARGSVQAQNQAYNSLRSRGGLSAGQRERMAMQGQRDLMNQTQGVRGQGAQDRLKISLQDQQSKDQMLSQLPQADMAAANFAQSQRAYSNDAQKFDLNNAMNDVRGFNAYQADGYGKAMQEWGAAKTADAQARASGGGGKK
jgi:hypothetical protein